MHTFVQKKRGVYGMDTSKKLYRAIFIDDEIWALRGLQGIVDWKEFGFDNIGAFTDSREALEALPELKPDVVFTDIRMPEIDGMTLIERARDIVPDAVFVIVSAYRDFEIAKQALKNQVSDYLIKPLDKTEVRQSLTALYEKLQAADKDSFAITDVDLLSEEATGNADVTRFVSGLLAGGPIRILTSEADISGCGLNIIPVRIRGMLYSYIITGRTNAFYLEDRVKGIRIGVSTEMSDCGDLNVKALEAVKSFNGCFFYSDNEQTAKIQDYLYDNLDKKITVEDVCSKFFLSKSYVFELFRENAEVSAMGFLKKVRLCHAADLLKLQKSSVSQVAAAVGFDDVGYFIKTFKSKYGCTPEQYSAKI